VKLEDDDGTVVGEMNAGFYAVSDTSIKTDKGKPRKICPQCGAEVLDVNKHLKRVCNKVPEQLDLKCPDCGRACSNKNQLNLHWSYVHEVVDNLFCNLCAKPCTNRMKLRQHTMVCIQKMKNKHDENLGTAMTWQSAENTTQGSNSGDTVDLLCNLCRKSYKSMEKLKRHTKKCLTDYLNRDVAKTQQEGIFENKTESSDENIKQVIACHDCGKPCSGIGALIKHRIKCFSGEKVKAEEYNKLAEGSSGELTVEKSEPVCDLVIKSETPDDNTSDDGLDTSAFQETAPSWQDSFDFGEDKTYPTNAADCKDKPEGGSSKMACHLCGKVLGNKRYLKAHILKMHSSARTKVVCEYCAKEFKSTNIKSHIKEMHINAVESKCPICGKVFPRKKPLSDHIRRVHSEETRVVCQYCAKDVKSTNIKNHIKEMHTDVQDTACPICGKVFPRKKPMTDHLRLVHSEEKAVCEICSKTFENRTYLLRHIRTFHSTSQMIFTCDFCLKQYRSSLQLRNHIKIVHVVNNAECGICGKVYKNKILLGKHHRKYHRDEVNPYVCDRVGEGTSNLRTSWADLGLTQAEADSLELKLGK